MFGRLFGSNKNRKPDPIDFALGMALLEDLDEADQRDVLESKGLDYDDLEDMDEWEREQAMEDAGLDPDDFDF